MQDKIFYLSTFGFVFGILFRTFVFVNLYLIMLILLISFFIMIFFLIISSKPRIVGVWNKWGIIFSIFLLFFSFGILRFYSYNKIIPILPIDQEVKLSGKIINEIDIRENNQKLVVDLNSKLKILITTDFSKDFEYGDEINFSGKLIKPENFTNDQGKLFSFL